MTAWTPVPETAHEIAADRSPSPMSLIRAPASRTSAMRSSWRGRSRMTTVMSRTRRPSASAIRPRFSVGALADVDLARDDRPDAQLLHVRVRGVGQAAGLRRREDRDRARPGRGRRGSCPRAGRPRCRPRGDPRRVPRRPTSSPMYSIGASSRSPSPMTIAPGEVDLVHRRAHRLGREPVGAVPVAAAHGRAPTRSRPPR